MPIRGLQTLTIVLCLFGTPRASLRSGEQTASPTAITGIENLRQVSPHILCGSQPAGVESFAGLAQRGVKVIISVDGAAPSIDEAHKHGLRYVHVPIGYGKITPQQRADLVAAVQSAGGPVFMHCHHGKHRGPAAAGYCGMAIGELSREQGVQLLTDAGTRQDYTGLWDAIRDFSPPSVPAGNLVERAEVEPIVAAMVRIDHHWSGLEKTLKSETVNSDEFRQEALLLTEEFRELSRTSKSTDKDFKQQLSDSVANAEALLKVAESGGNTQALKMSADKLLQKCADCHAQHRN